MLHSLVVEFVQQDHVKDCSQSCMIYAGCSSGRVLVEGVHHEVRGQVVTRKSCVYFIACENLMFQIMLTC